MNHTSALKSVRGAPPNQGMHILFDLDGTLSDPLVGIGRSINYALSHFGHAELELHELAIHIGPPIDQAFRSITGINSVSELAGAQEMLNTADDAELVELARVEIDALSGVYSSQFSGFYAPSLTSYTSASS